LLDLAQVMIGVGPGSFTGLRIGMSFAKGVACAGKVPLVGVSSFLGLAMRRAMIGGARGPLLVVSDARRQEVFSGEYAVAGGQAVCAQEPTIRPDVTVSQWVERTGGEVVTMLRGWVVPGLDLVVESRIAEGLLAVNSPQERFSWQAVALLEPEYVRAVSAKSIAERRGA
jgi:tRNA threonylcarbamoyl adenosine modification protein YeaZ